MISLHIFHVKNMHPKDLDIILNRSVFYNVIPGGCFFFNEKRGKHVSIHIKCGSGFCARFKLIFYLGRTVKAETFLLTALIKFLLRAPIVAGL